MIEHSTLAETVQRQNEAMVEMVASLSDAEYAAACEDHAGATVGQVAAHCIEGYEQVGTWLGRLAGGAPAPEPAPVPHSHPHDHDHPHAHDAVELSRGEVTERLRASGRVVVERIGALSGERLRWVPPASPFANGEVSLELALRGLMGHLQEHLENMRAAVSRVHSG